MATDHIQRRAKRDIGIHVYNSKMLAEGLYTCHEFMSLVKSIKVLGGAVLKTPLRVPFLGWKKLSNADGQKLNLRNSVKEVYEISNFTGRDMIHCRLQSGAERWISVDLAMTFHKSAAKVVSWLEKNKPGDARIASKSKDFGLKMLEDRAKEVQGKYTLRSRKSQSRKSSPAKADEPAQVIQDSPEVSSPLPSSSQEDNQQEDVVFTSEVEVAALEETQQVYREGAFSEKEVVEDALARSAIAEARIQELEAQLRLAKFGDQELDFSLVPDAVPEVVEVTREELEAHQACLKSTRKSVAEARAKRTTSKAKLGSRSKLTEDQVNFQAAKAAKEVLSAKSTRAGIRGRSRSKAVTA